MRARTAPITVVAASLLAAAATAAPISWVNIPGSVNSRGLLGSAANAVINTPPLPANTGWQYLTISGNLTSSHASTYAAEACIELTTPSGNKIVMKPFGSGAFSGTMAVPAGAFTALPWDITTGAVCTLRFFELYADNAAGPDAVWSNLSITLHDDAGGDATPLTATMPPTADGPDVRLGAHWVDKGSASPGAFTFPTDRVVSSYRLKGYGSAMSGWNLSDSRSPLHYLRFTFTAPRADGTGDVTWTVDPYGEYVPSSSGFDLTADAPVPVLTGPTRPWSYSVSLSGGQVAPGTRTAVVWLGLQPLTGEAPAATDLGTIRGIPALGPAESTAVTSETFFTLAHEVQWFTFTTEHACSNDTGYWLDIHTQIPAGSPIVDHELGLYTPAGVRVAHDDDGGSFARSMLTFGDTSPVRTPVTADGGPKPRNGSNGQLAAGLHYLAVPQFNAAFATTGWYVTTEGVLGGSVGVEFRTNLPAEPCGPADVGSTGGVQGADGILDNNDFVAFIDLFFSSALAADLGTTGGLPGADGMWNNNDFVVFIDRFFAGCV
ncbi:MAG TPA: GC-type dockerin domain-anchored protein [Phycisphaerales bacterium]|nr:GC-type dockerin domain-anchored protein [Phycisphaerales bacterium]